MSKLIDGIQKARTPKIDPKIKERVARRIVVAKRTESIACVCSVSGISAILEIPSILPPSATIQQKLRTKTVMEWQSPLSLYKNCRGLAQGGASYLSSLDTQVLAGILIVLADNYDLFRYDVTMSAVQKNSILRTAGTTPLVSAISFIENYINTSNSDRLPRMSMLFDAGMAQNEMEDRLSGWLKTVATELSLTKQKKSSEEFATEDEFYSAVPKKTVFMSVENQKKKKERIAAVKAKSKELWQAQQLKWAADREKKDTLIACRKAVRSLATAATISSAVKSILLAMFADDTFDLLSSERKSKVIHNLKGLPQNHNTEYLIKVLEKANEKDESEDWLGAGVEDTETEEIESVCSESPDNTQETENSYVCSETPDAPEDNAEDSTVCADSQGADNTVVTLFAVSESPVLMDSKMAEIIPNPAPTVTLGAPCQIPPVKETIMQKLARINAKNAALRAAAQNKTE